MPDSEERLTELRQRWEADPGSRVFVQLAEEYRNLGRLEEAVSVLESGLEKSPNYVSAQVALGRCRFELGHLEAAVAVLEQVVRRDATQMVASRLLVEAYLRQGDLGAARERLDLYAVLNDADPQVEELRTALSDAEKAAASPSGKMPAKANLLVDVEELSPEPPTGSTGVDPVAAMPPPSARIQSEPDRPVRDGARGTDPFPDLHREGDFERYALAIAAEGLFPSEPALTAAAEAPLEPQPESGAQEVETEAEAPAEDSSAVPATPSPSGTAPQLFDLATPPAVEAPPPQAGGQIFDLAPAPLPSATTLPLESLPLPVVEELEEPEAAEPLEIAIAASSEVAEPQAAEVEEAVTARASSTVRELEPEDEIEHEPEVDLDPSALDLDGQPVTATLGQLYLQQGHTELAQSIFRKVLASEPGHPVALAGLATIEGRGARQRLTAVDLLRSAGLNPAAGLTERKVLLLKTYLQRLRAQG